MKLHEIKLSEPIKQYFIGKGYTVYCEIPHNLRTVDIVAIKGDEIIAIELKVGYCGKVLQQAMINQLFANKSYAAITKRPKDKNVLQCQENNVGVLLVNGKAISMSEPESDSPKPDKYYRDKILASCKKHKDNDLAGLPCQKGVGYAASVNAAVKEYRRLHPDASWIEIYHNVPNHYASAVSLKVSQEKWEHFKGLTDLYANDKCGDCRRHKTHSCSKGLRRRPDSKACVFFIKKVAEPKWVIERRKSQHNATDTKWDVDKYAPHQRVDAQTRNDNIDGGYELCKRCDGTGNELFSMYKKCSECGGSGRKLI